MPPRLFSRRPAPPHRPYSTSRTPSSPQALPSSPPPPRPSYFTLQALYPFLLLSTMTSLALNLSHSRATQETETSHLRAQISVLESILRRLTSEEERAGADRTKRRGELSPEEQETVERELELVGLGRGKDKDLVVGGGKVGGNAGALLEGVKPVAWAEVFFGKKGKEWEVDADADARDWEKAFQDASDADERKTQAGVAASQPAFTSTTPSAAAPLTSPPEHVLAPAALDPAQSQAAAPPRPLSKSAATYL